MYNPQQKLTGHHGAVYKLLDTKYRYFYSCGGDGYIVKWWKDLKINDGILIAKAESPIYAAFLFNNDNYLLAGCMDGSIVVIDLIHQIIIKNIKFHNKSVYDILIVKDKIFSCGGDGCLNIYNIDLSLILKNQISNQSLRCISVDEIENCLLIGSSDKCIYKIKLDDYEVVNKINAHNSSVFSLLIDNGKLYSGGRDAKLKLWKANTLDCISTIDAHQFSINDIIIFNDLLITASRDKTIRLWDENTILLQSLNPINGGHINSVNTLTTLYGTDYFASGSDDRSIIIWGQN